MLEIYPEYRYRGASREEVDAFLANPRVLAAIDAAHTYPERCLGNANDLIRLIFTPDWGEEEVSNRLYIGWGDRGYISRGDPDFATGTAIQERMWGLLASLSVVDGLYRIGLVTPTPAARRLRDIYEHNPSEDPEPFNGGIRTNRWVFNAFYEHPPFVNRRYLPCARARDEDWLREVPPEFAAYGEDRSSWPRRDWERRDFDLLISNRAFMAAFEAAGRRWRLGIEPWHESGPRSSTRVYVGGGSTVSRWRAFEIIWGRPPKTYDERYGRVPMSAPNEDWGLSVDGYYELHEFLERAVAFGYVDLPADLREDFPEFYYGLEEE